MIIVLELLGDAAEVEKIQNGFGTVRVWGVWKQGDNDLGPVIAQICIENPGGKRNREEFQKYTRGVNNQHVRTEIKKIIIILELLGDAAKVEKIQNGFGTVRVWGVWKQGDNDLGPVIAQICIETPGGKRNREEFQKYGIIRGRLHQVKSL